MKAGVVTRDQAGFTLIELLIVIVIEALIVGALGSAFVLVTNNSSQVKESLSRTGDARIAAAYIVSDARNSSGPETSLSDNASCPDPSPPVSGTPTAVVRFNWNTTSSVGATTPNIVNYVLVSNVVLRRQCRNGALVSDTALATNVTSVTVACAPTANCSGTPNKITATITETPELAGGPSFQYSLTGAFRKALAVGAALPVPLSISGPATLPSWTINRAYASTSLTGAGGGGTYIWSAAGLPAGLTISSAGVITGTPTALGTSTPTITLNDSVGDTPATRQYSVTISVAPSITSTSPLPNAGQNLAYSTTVAKSGGTAPFTWAATGLPAGLASDSTTGVIRGTPTATGTSAASVTLTDASGATANKSLSITVAPTITSVVLLNGGATAGKLETVDSIEVTFSATMKVNSFCSTWTTGDAANQVLNANNDVSVNVSNGASGANDILTVTSATCSFKFGSLDLGSPSYVSTAMTFGGAGSNKSTVAWTTSTHKLLITLGTAAGTATTVTSSAPTYTASAAVVDPNGSAVFNTPYALAVAKQF